MVGMNRPEGVLTPNVKTVMTHLKRSANANCHIDRNNKGPADPINMETTRGYDDKLTIARRLQIRKLGVRYSLKLERSVAHTRMFGLVKDAIAERISCSADVLAFGK